MAGQGEPLADLETWTHLTNPRGSAPKSWPSFKGEAEHVPAVLGGPGRPVAEPLDDHPRLARMVFKVPARRTAPHPSVLALGPRLSPAFHILSPHSSMLAPEFPEAESEGTRVDGAGDGSGCGGVSARNRGLFPPSKTGGCGGRRSSHNSVRRHSLSSTDLEREALLLRENVRSAKALTASEFGAQPVVLYGPSIPEYLRHNAFAFPPSKCFNPQHPAMVLPLPLLFRIFRYFSIADLFAFSSVDWAAKDRVDEYLLFSSIVLGGTRSVRRGGRLDVSYDTISISSSDSELSLVKLPHPGGGRRRLSIASVGSNGAGRRKGSLSAVDDVSSRALAMKSMRAEIQRYQSVVARLKAKLTKRKDQLTKFKGQTKSANAKTVKVMQQLANKNDALRMALAEERTARAKAEHAVERLTEAQLELKAGAAVSAEALDKATHKNRSLKAHVQELQTQVAQLNHRMGMARSSAAMAARAREKADARVAYLETLGFDEKAKATLATVEQMESVMGQLRDDRELLLRDVQQMRVIVSAHQVALRRTIAVAAPALEAADVSLAELRSDVLEPLQIMMAADVRSQKEERERKLRRELQLAKEAQLSASVDALDEVPDLEPASPDALSMAYLRSADPLSIAHAAAQGSPDALAQVVALVGPHAKAGSRSVDQHLSSLVQRLMRTRARNALILFCAQFMGKRGVSDPLRWGAAVYIQTWWRHCLSARAMARAQSTDFGTGPMPRCDSTHSGLGLDVRGSGSGAETTQGSKAPRRVSKLVLPRRLPYWHDRYEPKRVVMEVEAIDIDLLIRRITAPSQRDVALTNVTLATFPEFMDAGEFLRLLVARYFSLPVDLGDLPFFLASVQPMLQQQVLAVLLEWLVRFSEDFSGNDAASLRAGLGRFLERTLENATDPAAREMLEAASLVLALVGELPRESMLACTPLGQALRAGAIDWELVRREAEQAQEPRPASRLVLAPRAPQSLLLDPGPLRSLVQVHPIEVARQLALIDFAMFVRVERKELLRQAFVKPDSRRGAPHIQGLIDQFNATSSWAMTQVLMGETADERAVLICMLVDVARECQQLGNYSAMMALVSGLQGAAVSRLKFSWALVPDEYTEHWDDLKRALSMNHNYHAYREALRRQQAPAVPYLGVFLQDLVFIDDGNPSLVAPHNLINMAKHAMNAGVINELLRLQAAPYEYHAVEDIQVFLRSAAGIDEDTLFARSLELEPRDAKPPRRRLPVTYNSLPVSTWMHVELDAPEVLDDLVANTTVEEFEAGSLVLKAGHASKYMYYVAHGVLQVHLPRGPVVLLSDGQLVGEMAVFMGSKRSANVSAVTHVTLLKLPSKNLGVLLRKHPQLQQNLAALARFRAEDIKKRAEAPPPPSKPKWYSSVSQPSALRWTRAGGSATSGAKKG
ncbi:uncharacterized protein AMSG_03989 [Thecamonas trahens ATCC 50062]|uniref:Uncharacterized protein n=1 Tax=Thecamonas trahens ATCC 50062 TaxID=461836 RepID=A0A0L0D5V4_THETB|nr:hypothetical protein AMSG_03989 [Thecamonas trahens ATCC 50062]KNC47762.1 hypothetical protein AMSG_03989 [Thecamonas trahens ATCC 50062]|eukprot:XP_013759240.1 hypothetical protein AMSG_03989 [Thecamonas trahens ATCC 50062]